ncbi:amino acid/polyamine transporter I [Aspergillus sergii]|uniref:Amino acid/polyamine transporter I n=1 Tax=Aspergillus sergii TaxID=1034303 RepID=A0A5N6X519_9EURO|nr:amino acid/polyamine transporter I [Aspergillus sergii]
MLSADLGKAHAPPMFGLWSAISLGWLTLNVFGGMSFILFIGLTAGGMPAILYGFIGSSAAVICIILTFAQCASRFSTAGGAYHYACFLLPPEYRRQIAYPLGWLNYLGWILTHAGCCAIVATLTLALVNLCNPDTDISGRWKLFLVYLIVDVICWLFNLVGVKGIPALELFGCYATALGFVAYTIALLVRAPKADPSFVFVNVNNETGYTSTSLVILLGLFNSFGTLMGLDGPAHLAEELPQAKKSLPRIMLIVIGSQFVVGVIWIIVLGFSITDLDAINNTTTGVPVLEVIRLGTGSDVAAIVFCLLLIINNATSALGSAVTMSRQGYAFARHGGLFWNSRLIKPSPRLALPFWSTTLPYFFSNAAFNAIIGSQATCMIISFGSPAAVLLFTRGDLLPNSNRWNLGICATPIYLVSVGYSILVVIVSMIPQTHPLTAVSMNYTVLVMGFFMVAMTLAWILEGRRLFLPPANDESIAGKTCSQGHDHVLGSFVVRRTEELLHKLDCIVPAHSVEELWR